MDRPVALIGLPGSGKSTIGKQLARKFHWGFFDSDSLIEEAEGCTVREIFERDGEKRFRELETAAIDDLTQKTNCVISTGGGAILNPSNREVLKSRCTCIYLKSTPEDLIRRLRNDRRRPLLQVADPIAALKELFLTRDPMYSATATLVVETGRPSVHTLVDFISGQLHSPCVSEGIPPNFHSPQK
jgi:shikimate kinase